MTLPPKPEQVAHVSDALWEAALNEAARKRGVHSVKSLYHLSLTSAIDHARLLILQGEVKEPVDPLDEALDNLWANFHAKWTKREMKAEILKHLAGLTIPENPA